MKKIVSFFLCIVLILTFSVSAFAAEAGGLICPTCGSAVIVHSDTIEGIYHNIEYVCSNKECDYKRKEKKILGMESVSGATATPIEGVTAPPSGYAGEGVPSINQTGKLQFTLTPHCGYSFTTSGSFKEDIRADSSHTSCSRKLYGRTGNSYYYFRVSWTGTAPVTGGYYYIPDSNTDLGYVRGLSGGGVFNRDIYTGFDKMSVNDHHLVGVGKKSGENITLYSQFSFSSGVDYFVYANPLVLEVEPFEVDNTISNRNYITINNNTLNGNIYIDNSNNLTYIYPQYTTINENNENVTNISNNPIIYNQETKQYYTYDQTTNNYYYIIFNAPTPTPTPDPMPSPSPDPAPTPTPSPSPDPGGSTPDPDKPSPTPTPGGSDSSGVGSGTNPFKWLADLLKDIVEGIFKAVWKLTTSIFGFLIWLVGLLVNVLPFLPSEGLAALSAAAIIITVLRIIKFILGR